MTGPTGSGSAFDAASVPGMAVAVVRDGTVRHLLSHRSGLPNLFGSDALAPEFDPGTRFGYSSVGYAYLQRLIEAVAREPLEATLRRLVFEPLGMRRSSLIWQRRFEADHARPHEHGEPLDKHCPSVAWSLGWGVEPDAGTFFQWGETRGIRAFSMGSRAARVGVVVLSNGETGLRAIGPLLAEVLPGEHPAVGWLRACVTE
jgi:CubicO group peptidase (beta-lactamase class C family)